MSQLIAQIWALMFKMFTQFNGSDGVNFESEAVEFDVIEVNPDVPSILFRNFLQKWVVVGELDFDDEIDSSLPDVPADQTGPTSKAARR